MMVCAVSSAKSQVHAQCDNGHWGVTPAHALHQYYVTTAAKHLSPVQNLFQTMLLILALHEVEKRAIERKKAIHQQLWVALAA